LGFGTLEEMRRTLLLLTFLIGCGHTNPQQATALSSKAPPNPLEPYVGVWIHADESSPETLTINANGTFDWQITKGAGEHCRIAGTVAYAEVAPGETTPGYDGPGGYDESDGDSDESGDGDSDGENPCDGGEGESAMNLAQMPGDTGIGGAPTGGYGSMPARAPSQPRHGQLVWTMTTNECNDAYQGKTTGDWVVHVDADHLGLSDADPSVSNTDTVEYTRQR
jgi:hypothetical protein